jgi:16S rRNA (cytosine967-C5)-methyltransferase
MMPVSPARLAAFDILLRIDMQDAYSSELLHSERMDELFPQDRGLCMELVMGVLRWRSRLDAQIAKLSFTPFRKLDPEVVTALRLGAYQVQFLGRIPARAAINESVELVKHARKMSAAPLVNAVLRKLPKTSNAERAALHEAEATAASVSSLSGPAELAAEFAHPQWLVTRWLNHYGPERTVSICRHDQQIPLTTVRLRDASVEQELLKEGIELAPGALLSSARHILAGDITHTHACTEGRAVIQDEGSQLIAALAGHGTRILDCCAAPGGKTAALADRNPQSEITAVELHEHRARLMRQLIRASNVNIVTADIRALPQGAPYDCILTDVPCSGTGTLARNPEIKWRLKPEDLADLHTRQVEILRAALQHLAPGGRLIYSSCSLEPEENEAVIEEVVTDPFRVLDVREQMQALQQQDELTWTDLASLSAGPYLRTVPGVHPCDGFFAAILEKHA